MNRDKLLEEIKKIKRTPDHIYVLCREISALDLHEAKDTYLILLEMVEQQNFHAVIPWIHHHLGWVYYDLCAIDESIRCHEKALHAFQKQENSEGELSSITALVAVHGFVMNYRESCEYGLYGIKQAEKYNNYERLHSIKSNLGITYCEMEAYEKAKSLFIQINQLANIGKKNNEIMNYINLCECDRHLRNYEEALKYINRAYEMAIGFDEKKIPSILDHKGRIFTEMKRYEEAEQMFKESVAISNQFDSEVFLYDALYYWARLDIERDYLGQALEKLIVVKTNIDKLHSQQHVKQLYHTLYVTYKALGEPDRAIQYLEKFLTMKQRQNEQKNKMRFHDVDSMQQRAEKETYKTLYTQLQSLYEVGQRLTSILHQDDIYTFLAAEMGQLIQNDGLQIFIYSEEHQQIHCNFCIDRGEHVELASTPITEDSLVGYCIRHQKPILVNDFYQEYHKYIGDIHTYMSNLYKEQTHASEIITQSIIFVPIVIDQKVIGVLSAQCYEKNRYTLQDVSNLKIFSTFLGVALENARLYKELEYSANYDTMTGVLNRREALRTINHMYHAEDFAQRYIIMIDIDDFKTINDTYGHQKGDEVVVEVAKSIKNAIRESDIVGRYGGEEFIAIITAQSHTFMKIAERIRKRVEQITIFNEHNVSIPVTVSIGIAQVNSDRFTLEQVIRLSDSALYEAKSAGKNCVVLCKQSV
ncbi:MAG: diguanylate cyclase [Bacilli bacterium]